MNPYIGDRQLDPDDDNGCEHCSGLGTIANLRLMRNDPCRHCNAEALEDADEPDNCYHC